MELELGEQICYIVRTAAGRTGSGTSQYKKLGKIHMDVGYGSQGAPGVGNECGSVFCFVWKVVFAV
jgi:hypothetical protein